MSEKRTVPYGTAAIFAIWIGVIGLVYVLLMPSQKTVPPELDAILRPEPKSLQPFTLVDPHVRLLAGFSPPHDPATIVEQVQQIRALGIE